MVYKGPKMKPSVEPIEVERLTRLNEYGPDDLFICCASFEERCISSTSKMGADFRTRFAVIFVMEEPLYKKQVDNNLFRLKSELGKGVPKVYSSFPAREKIQLRGLPSSKISGDSVNPRILKSLSLQLTSVALPRSTYWSFFIIL